MENLWQKIENFGEKMRGHFIKNIMGSSGVSREPKTKIMKIGAICYELHLFENLLKVINSYAFYKKAEKCDFHEIF